MSIKISYNTDIIKIMSLFENVTRTRLKDCFIDENQMLTFIVAQGEIGKAVGKKASNVRKLEGLLNRKIKIVEFNSDVLGFINNLLFPLRTRNIKRGEEGIFMIEAEDLKTRGLIIGRNAKNLRNFENIAQKYYPEIKEIKVK